MQNFNVTSASSGPPERYSGTDQPSFFSNLQLKSMKNLNQTFTFLTLILMSIGFSDSIFSQTFSYSPAPIGGAIYVCEGGQVTLTLNGTLAGEIYSLNANPPDPIAQTLTAAGSSLTFSAIYYPSTSGSPFSISIIRTSPSLTFYPNQSVIVTSDPTPPTLTLSQAAGTVCAGPNLSATLNSPGSDGNANVPGTNSYHYRIDGGAWIPYGLGVPISTTTYMLNTVEIRAKRSNDVLGCSAENIYTWNINSNVHDVTGTQGSYCSIQQAIDAATTAPGDELQVEAGTYNENVVVSKLLTIQGSGSTGQTHINGSITFSVSGLDATNRSVVKDISVTNSAPAGDGVIINNGISYITIDNVASISNTADGVEILGGGTTNTDLLLKNIRINDNGTGASGTGIRMGGLANVNGLTLMGGEVKRNAQIGFSYNSSASAIGLTNVVMDGVTFEHNGDDTYASTIQLGTGDISFFSFDGNATIQNVTVLGGPSSNAAHIGVQFRGKNASTPAGNISITGLTITGSFKRPALHGTDPSGPGYGLVFMNYTDVSTVSMNNINVNVDDGHALFVAGLTTAINKLNVGNASFTAQNSNSSHIFVGTSAQNNVSSNVNATGATFYGVLASTATIDQHYTIEDKVYHKLDDNNLGFVPWKSNGDSYVTPNSGDIQEGINAVSAPGTVHIKAGSYTENVDASSKEVILKPGSSPGCVTINGNLTLGILNTLEMEANSTTACTGYDQFTVTGTVNLGGSSLVLAGSHVPSPGELITLIDGSSAIVGQFVQGTTVTNGPYTYVINYAGGPDGFDVVLRPCPLVTNMTTSETFCSLQSAINDSDTQASHTLKVESNFEEGLVSINKAVIIDGNGKTLNSTSAGYGLAVTVAGVSISNLTVDNAGTFALHASCGSNALLLTNFTASNSGGTGIALNGSDNCVLTNVTSTNNGGNGISVTNCDNLTINGITTSGNTFISGFNAGIGLFTSSVTCPTAGISNFTLSGVVSIAETVKVYSEKSNAADPITGTSGSSISWAVGVGALARTYWPDKATAYAVVDASFDAPYNYPNTQVYVEEVATDNLYVDDNPNGVATPPMLIQTAVTFASAGKTVFVESGTYNEQVAVNKSLTIEGNTGVATDVVLDANNKISGGGTGFSIQANNVSIKDLTVREYELGVAVAAPGYNAITIDNAVLTENFSSGFYSNQSISGLTINLSTLSNNNGGGFRRGVFLQSSSANFSNISMTGNTVTGNGLVGLDVNLNNSVEGLTITGNSLSGNGDAAIGVWLGKTTTASAPVVVSGNMITISSTARFGIEIKNPNATGLSSGTGSVVLQNNNVSLVSIANSDRDLAGLAIIRRKDNDAGINDIPKGVYVSSNTFASFKNIGAGDGFGVAAGGRDHSFINNTINNNDVGIQTQAGNSPTDSNNSNQDATDLYFGRDNSQELCNITITPLLPYLGNTTDERIVTGGVPGTIQTAITPTVDDPSDQLLCTGLSTAAVTFTGNVMTGKVYNWTNDNTTIGLAASGTGDIASFTTTNTTNTVQTATITVTPVANGCAGTPQTFTISVKPTPTVDDPANQVVCNGTNTTAVNFASAFNVAGTTFAWTADANAVSIGYAASGSTSTPSFAAVNITNAPITGTITVSPTADGCPGTPQTFTVTVNPTPTVDDPADQVVCNGFNTTAVNFASVFNVSGTTYTWTADANAVSIGYAANGNTSTPVVAAINNTMAPVVGTITVTPSANGCPGTPESFTVTVNPTPAAPTTVGVVLNCDATATLTASGYTGTLLWSTSETTPSITVNANGTYTVTQTLLGCTSPSGSSGLVTLLTNSGTWYVNGTTGNDNNIGSASCPVATIGKAIMLASNTDIINVAAGTYAENITANKQLDIRGPNYNISPNTGSRVAEAIIVPSVSDPVAGNVITVTTSNVSVDGFTIDGDNTLIGVAKDALRGVFANANGLTNVDVSKNIVRNLEGSGIRYQQSTSFNAGTVGATFSYNNVINDNLIQNITSLGIDLRNSMYAKITDNTISNIRYGIFFSSFRIKDFGISSDRIISGNTIETTQFGIWPNLFSATPYAVNNNTITAVADPIRTKWYGIMMATVSGAQNFENQLNLPLVGTPESWTFLNNNIDGAGVDPGTLAYGYWLFYLDNFRDNLNVDHFTAISGGNVSNVDYGIYMQNRDVDPVTSFGVAAVGAHANISGVNISVKSGGAGIFMKDDPSWTSGNPAPLINKRDVKADISDCTITGGNAGILVSGGSFANATIHDNSATITGAVIGVDIDGGTASLVANKIDANGTGVRVKNGGTLTSTINNFITNNTTDGISIEATSGAIGAINNNNLSGNAVKAINNAAASAIAATCNWYGSNVLATVAGKVSGPVTYVPYLSNGTDVGAMSTDGFQPDPAACGNNVMIASAIASHEKCGLVLGSIAVTFSDGLGPYSIAWTGPSSDSDSPVSSGYVIPSLAAGNYTITVTSANGTTATTAATVLYLPVHNTTANTYHPTIQAAIDAASDEDDIFLCAGTYTENATTSTGLNTGKRLSFTGATDISGAPISIINGSLYLNDNDVQTITNVRFKSDGVASNHLVQLKNTNGLTFTNCIFDGDNNLADVVNGINHISGPNGNSDIEVNNCKFIDGIYVGIGSRFTGLTVQNTLFDNIKSGINHQSADNVLVEDCTFNLNGGSSYGVRFGSNPDIALNLTIRNSDFNIPLTGNTAIWLRTGAGGTVLVENNSIIASTQIFNESTVLVNAPCNWWGSGTAMGVKAIVEDPVKVSGNVKVASYLVGNGNSTPALGFTPTDECTPSPVRLYTDLTNTTLSNAFFKIQPAVNAATGAQLIEVGSGTYNEQVIVNKGVKILGVGAIKPIVDFTGTVTGKPTLFDVSSDGVTIENINFNVDLSKLRSAVIASSAGLDAITVKDNMVGAYGTPTGSYGDRNAVSVNYGGSTNYRVATGGVNSVVFTGNTVTGTAPDSYYRSGISVDEGGLTATGNTLTTINHDVLLRFASNGANLISGNTFNGGGVELSDENAGSGTITVSSNNFNGAGAPNTAVLRIKNNYNSIPHVISSNTFTNYDWGVSMENANTVTLDQNTFTTTVTSAHAVTVNTKSLSSNSNTIVQVPVSATMTKNNFNGTGNAITFLNHDSDNDSYGTITIGSAGNENNFSNTLSSFIVFDGQTGTTDATMSFPVYPVSNVPNPGNNLGWPTTKACWDQNLNAQYNNYNVGSGLQLPTAMSFAGRTTLESKLTHDPDIACLGLITYFLPVHNLTQNTYFLTIGAAVAAANTNDVIECSEWTFNERVIIDKPLTLQGVDSSAVVLTGTGLPGTGSGIHINNGITNVTIKKLRIQNFTGAGNNNTAGIFAQQSNSNLTIDSVSVLNNPSNHGIFCANSSVINQVSITKSTVRNHGPGLRGIVIWDHLKTNITITDNVVTNNACCGIELQDGDASKVTVTGNTVDIGGGDNAIGLTGLNATVGLNLVDGNTITGGGRFGIEIKNPAGGVTVSNNSVSLTTINADLRDRAGISVFRRGVLYNNVDVPNGVTITGNTVTGYTQTLPEEGFGIVIEGTNHNVTGNIISNCNIGIQQQGGGHANSYYPNLPQPEGAGNGAQGVGLSPNYFGRGNSPYACGNVISGNTLTGNGASNVPRNVISANNFGLVTNNNNGETFCNIQAAINDAQTSNGHTINVSASTFNENVTVNKPLTIKGAQFGQPCATRLGAESIIAGGAGTAFTIASIGVTIDGFDITGRTGIASTGFTDFAVRNNKIAADWIGINITGLNTATAAGTIDLNCVDMTTQFNGDVSQPTVGILLNGVNGAIPLTVTDNKIQDGHYGYVLHNINPASVKQEISGGTIKGVMQGVAVVNTLTGAAPYASSKVEVDNVIMSMFAGSSVIPEINFHAGIYGFTGGGTTTETIELDVNNGSISGTGKPSQSSSGIYIADFSTGAVKQTVEINNALIQNNKNRGIDARGKVSVSVTNSIIDGNGYDAFGAGGNDGFAMIAQQGAIINATNNFITHPAASATTVTTFLTANGTGSTINATNNSVLMNGNPMGKGATNDAGHTINATCNWWGVPCATNIAALMSGIVTYDPFLVLGTEDVLDIPTIGFQPMSGACTGTLTASIAGIATLCEPGLTSVLTGSDVGGYGTITYTWSSATPANVSLSPTNVAVTTATSVAQGTSLLTFTVTDQNGCTDTETVVFTVTNPTVFPTYTIPAMGASIAGYTCGDPVVRYTDPASCNSLQSIIKPVWADNCSIASTTASAGVVVLTDFGTYASGIFPKGMTTVTFTATDGSGNTTTCTVPINVLDNIPPVFSSLPTSFTVAAPPGDCSLIVNWVPPVANDNCPGTVTITSNFNPGAVFVVPSVNTITYTATDAAGITATYSFIITVTGNCIPAVDLSLQMPQFALNPLGDFTLPVVKDGVITVKNNGVNASHELAPLGNIKVLVGVPSSTVFTTVGALTPENDDWIVTEYPSSPPGVKMYLFTLKPTLSIVPTLSKTIRVRITPVGYIGQKGVITAQLYNGSGGDISPNNNYTQGSFQIAN